MTSSWESAARPITAAEREVFIMHRFNPAAPDFFSPAEQANIFHGVGLREDVFYPWFIAHRIHRNWVSFLERFAQGVLIIMHADHDDAAAAAEQAVEDYKQGNFILMPIHADSTDIKKFDVKILEAPANTGGLFKEYLLDYSSKKIRDIIEGQELTSTTAPTGLGSGVASAHQSTFQLFVRYDAMSLQRTLTEQLVWRLQRWNGIMPDVRLRWEFAIEDTEAQQKMDAVNKAHGMGVSFIEDEVRELTGMSRPTEDDNIIGGMSMQQDQGLLDFGEQPPGQPNAGGNGDHLERIRQLLS